ncbi:MAG TPA: glycine cleavage system protein GcvH [Acidobacteriota bacterium]|nr:glycine cleavage system protein GcvH [Acidobacteriota bacterium]
MNVPDDLFYTEDHEWVMVEGDTATIGITDYAQEELGDVVFVELPEVGDAFTAKDSFGSVESVKAVSEIYAPVSGEVVEVNESLTDAPETVNEDPYGEGWMIRLKLENSAELDNLMSADDYKEFLKEEVG